MNNGATSNETGICIIPYPESLSSISYTVISLAMEAYKPSHFLA